MVMLRRFWRLQGLVLRHVLYWIKGGVWEARRQGVTVGENCRIYTKAFGTEPFLIEMGDGVTLASGVRILTHHGSTALVRSQSGYRFQHYAPVRLGDQVFVGVGAIILPGVTIGSNVVVGAGAVVTHDIPDNSVVVGNPARKVGSFDDYKARVRLTCVSDEEIDHATDYVSRVRLALSLQAEKNAVKRKGLS